MSDRELVVACPRCGAVIPWVTSADGTQWTSNLLHKCADADGGKDSTPEPPESAGSDD
jgi:hypothetical protein